MWRLILIVLAVVFEATPSLACSVIGPLKTPQELVAAADLIVRVRMEDVQQPPAVALGPHGFGTVRFRVLQTLKGTSPADLLLFEGERDREADRNDRPAPYDFVRPGGRHGNCYALNYLQGAEYLLLAKNIDVQGQPHELSIYWAPLAPTNEQVTGESDPWVQWVMAVLAGSKDPAYD